MPVVLEMIQNELKKSRSAEGSENVEVRLGELADLPKHGWIDQQIKVKVSRNRKDRLYNIRFIRFQLHQMEDTKQDLCQPKQL